MKTTSYSMTEVGTLSAAGWLHRQQQQQYRPTPYRRLASVDVLAAAVVASYGSDHPRSRAVDA